VDFGECGYGLKFGGSRGAVDGSEVGRVRLSKVSEEGRRGGDAGMGSGLLASEAGEKEDVGGGERGWEKFNKRVWSSKVGG